MAAKAAIYKVIVGLNAVRKCLKLKGTGGEGGIRTLGTGISQYNGLANLSFLGSLSRLNGLQSGWMHQNWLNKVSLGNFCSPVCSPVFGESRWFSSTTTTACVLGRCSSSWQRYYFFRRGRLVIGVSKCGQVPPGAVYLVTKFVQSGGV